MATVEVGKFSIDTDTGVVVGPAEYMRECGIDRLRSIERGEDVVVNHGYQHQPDIYTLILVSLQTDYAGWRGQKQMEGWLT